MAPKKRTIVFALDPSEHSKTALKWGMLNHIRQNDMVVVLSVGDSADKVVEQAVATVESMAKELFTKSELQIVRSAVKGKDPRDVIVENVENLRADTLIMGSRGLTGVKRALLGSVSMHCVTELNNCAVIIIK